MPQRPLEARRTVAPRARRPDASFASRVRFREAGARGISALVALINEAYRPVDWWLFGHVRTSEDELRRSLSDPETTHVVAEVDGELAGHFALHLRQDGAEFGLVARAEQFAGQGLPALLVQEAERRARDAGYEEMELGCIRENGLQAYYESLGYRGVREERSRQWGAQQDFTLVHMRRKLR